MSQQESLPQMRCDANVQVVDTDTGEIISETKNALLRSGITHFIHLVAPEIAPEYKEEQIAYFIQIGTSDRPINASQTQLYGLVHTEPALARPLIDYNILVFVASISYRHSAIPIRELGLVASRERYAADASSMISRTRVEINNQITPRELSIIWQLTFAGY